MKQKVMIKVMNIYCSTGGRVKEIKLSRKYKWGNCDGLPFSMCDFYHFTGLILIDVTVKLWQYPRSGPSLSSGYWLVDFSTIDSRK